MCKFFTSKYFRARHSVNTNLCLKRVVHTLLMSFPNWWLSSVRETRSTRFAGGVTTFGLLKEWRCRTRNLDESSVSLDFWCGTGLPWVSLSWALHPALPSLSWKGSMVTSARKGSFPCCFTFLLPFLFFFLWFTSPKWPFFLFLGEEAWPVFSYLPCTWPHKSWDIHKTLGKEFSPKMNVALWRV